MERPERGLQPPALYHGETGRLMVQTGAHIVSNRQKWDGVEIEGSGTVWRSGELAEGLVLASRPFDRLELHLPS